MPIFTRVSNDRIYWGILLLNAMMFLVWPLAHTIALRKSLLLLAGIAGIVLLIKSPARNAILKQPWLKWMGVLLLWVILHAGLISQNGNEAWLEFKGQWVPVYIAILAGIGVGLAGQHVEVKWFERLLLACALALPVFYVIANLVKWAQVGYLPVGYMLPGELNDVRAGTDLKTSLTFSLEMLVPFACVKLLDLWKSTGRFTLRTLWILPLILAMVVAVISLIKNFMILLSLSVILLLLTQGFRSGVLNIRRVLLGLSGLTILAFILVMNVGAINKSWQHAVSDTRIAWDIDNYQNWKNDGKYGLPQNEFGETLSESYYLRVAFAHAGIRAALETPWGYGVTRKAMERIEQQKNVDISLANAHNGYLNLACAVGLPGLGLFVMAMVFFFRQTKESTSKWAAPAIWMIGLYLLHWALDAVERDHFFEMFMFMIALVTTLALMDNKKHGQI